MNEIKEKAIVEEKEIIKGLQIKEKLFDQITSLNVGSQPPFSWNALDTMIKDAAYAWVHYYPKGSMHKSRWIIMLRDSKLYRTGMFDDATWNLIVATKPQLFIN